jgi:hypothetical protein
MVKRGLEKKENIKGLLGKARIYTVEARGKVD